MAEEEEQYPAEIAARRRDAVLQIMVNTPPQPHAIHRQDRAKRRKTTASDQAKKAGVRQRKP
jgi:hypothetical protein